MSSYLLSVAKERWQHERTRTRTDVFSNFHAASGDDMVKFIPNSLSFAFTVWMYESGYYVSAKKDCIVMKRSNDVAKISMVETDMGFAMNDVCQKRFLSFCRAYLNRDKNYIDQLRMRGMAKINQNSYQMVA